MKRSYLLLVILLVLAACGPADSAASTPTAAPATTTTVGPTTSIAGPTPTTVEASFPVTVTGDNGEVTIDDRPDAVISLSATATEMLFAVGAGPQVVAVDEQSNYPAEAPVTDLSGFTPNVEAILAYEPDLVVIGFDPGDLEASLEVAGVDVISFGPALGIDDMYRQIEGLGAATGNVEGAEDVNDSIANDLAEAAEGTPDGSGVTYYHEVDNTLYTATATTFIGQIYALFGLENIADPADPDGAAFGYPQLSSEYVVEADPDIIFLANSLYGESAETVAARPGWDVLTAVAEGQIVEIDSDISSRWGPRIVDFAESVADALEAYAGQG